MEYLYNIPWEMKFYGGMEKGLLRKALEGVLPDEFLYCKKIHIQKLIIQHIKGLLQVNYIRLLIKKSHHC